MSKESNYEIFLDKCKILHSEKYDYSLVRYFNQRTNIKIICKKHGIFEQRPDIHLKLKGCNKCFVEERGVKTFIESVNIIHNNKYDYDLSNYINRTSKINIICKEHGDFYQTPHKHLQGKGCPKCKGGVKSNIHEFIIKVDSLHNSKYTYDKSVYINNYTNITITCKEHGDFYQKPTNHLQGKGCTKCVKKFGIKENKWLDSLNIKERQVRIGKYIVDGYDESTNTIYEFNGDFWHGNPELYNGTDMNSLLNKTFGELYRNTIDREKYLIKKGYNFISIWENDFNKVLIKVKPLLIKRG
jgi:very-short-patch-repair endonuclease